MVYTIGRNPFFQINQEITMKQKTLLFCIVAALMLSVFVIDTAPVSARIGPPPTPAAGQWIVSEEDAIEGLIPQYQLEAPTGGYALLQSDAVKVSGYTRICHPYRGGQYGWTSEIRTLTPLGWTAVPTTSGWEPDEEGQYMTCADVGSGTYAVFGYWDKPAWWGMCPPAGYSEFYMDVRDLLGPGMQQGERCGARGSIIFDDGMEIDLTGHLYCCNYNLYWADFPVR
jgi:hypothetical protein